MKYLEYCVLEYVGYGRGQKAKELTAGEMNGWLDSHHKWVTTDQEIAEAIQGLLRQGLIERDGERYRASAMCRAMRRAAWRPIGDFLNAVFLTNAETTEECFRQALKEKYGALEV